MGEVTGTKMVVIEDQSTAKTSEIGKKTNTVYNDPNHFKRRHMGWNS